MSEHLNTQDCVALCFAFTCIAAVVLMIVFDRPQPMREQILIPTPTPAPIINRVEAVKVQPGDTLVFQCPLNATLAQITRIRETLNAEMKDVKVLVLYGDLKLQTVLQKP